MSNPPSLNLHAPPPPSYTDTKQHPNPTLLWIQDRIAELYSLKQQPESQHNTPTTSSPPISNHAAFLNIYNAVNSYITATKAKRGGLSAAHARAELSGEDLYRSLEGVIRTYCQESSGDIDAATDILPVYLERWGGFVAIKDRAMRLFRDLDRHWISRVRDEKRMEVYSLQDLHLRIWREEVLDGEGKVVGAVRRLLLHDEAVMGDDERGLLEGYLASLGEVGVELVDGGGRDEDADGRQA